MHEPAPGAAGKAPRVLVTVVAALPTSEYWPGGHAVQLSADCAEYCPAAHGVHICGLPRTVPESTEASSLPPRATYEPALHGPAHALVP